MTRSTSMDVRHLNKRLTKKLKAKAAAVSRAALTKQLLQGLLAKSLLKGRGVAIRMPLPLPWIALLMHHPLPMKPADSENRNERKLFIGMLSKKCNENDVRVMFSSFGTIEECTVLRDTSNQSKGCAFITFASRQCAINAIKSMNHSQTMEGCNSPLVVKFADTQKEKVIKRQQLMIANLWNMANVANLGSFTPQYLTGSRTSAFSGFVNLPQIAGSLNRMNLQQQLVALTAAHASSNNSNSGLNPVVMRNIAALASTGGNNTSTRLPLTATGNKSRTSSVNGKNTKSLVTNMPLGTNSSTMENLTAANGNVRSASNISANGPSLDLLAQAYTGMQKICALPGFSQLSGLHQSQNPAGKQIEGPDGANLFIYHLPQEFNDTDLAQTFLPFGNVISAKVFIDKQTNLSKCFGFVSYDNPANAQAAIQAMNGFQIGMKRLKVQLKRSKDANKPY